MENRSVVVILSVAKDLNKINSIRDSSASPQNDIGIIKIEGIL
jgi:hypothetical protein